MRIFGNRLGLALALCLAFGTIVASTLSGASGSKAKSYAPRDVTLIGKVVDLHSYMTGKAGSNDMARWTQMAIRSGVPAALETEDGLILIGQGEKGPTRTILPFAFKPVELRGKLYEKDGVVYIDVVSASRPKSNDGEVESSEELEDDADLPPDE